MIKYKTMILKDVMENTNVKEELLKGSQYLLLLLLL
jgi:hypothetical protein